VLAALTQGILRTNELPSPNPCEKEARRKHRRKSTKNVDL
jgi:hypothetical protein